MHTIWCDYERIYLRREVSEAFWKSLLKVPLQFSQVIKIYRNFCLLQIRHAHVSVSACYV